MATLTFNTHFFVKQLIRDGIPEKQAESIVEFVRETRETDLGMIATKGDIKELKTELKSDIRELELRMQNQMKDMQNQMKDMQIKIGAMIMALGGVLVAIKYFG